VQPQLLIKPCPAFVLLYFCVLPCFLQVKEVPPAAAAWASEFSSEQQRPSMWGEEFASFQAQQHPAAAGAPFREWHGMQCAAGAVCFALL